jgi:hypothetical protein
MVGLVAVVCTPLMFVAGPGYAATGADKSSTTTVLKNTDNRLNVLAGAGTAHDIRIDFVENNFIVTDTGFIVTDTGNLLMTAAPCVHLTDPERVSCPLPVSGITVEAAELNDTVQLSDSVTVPSRLVGGAGSDGLFWGARDDTLMGAPDAMASSEAPGTTSSSAATASRRTTVSTGAPESITASPIPAAPSSTACGRTRRRV